MESQPPSRIRVVSHEAVNEFEVKIVLEMIIDVHRLAEVGQEFLSQAIQQIGVKNRKEP